MTESINAAYPESLMKYVQKLYALIEEGRQGALERNDVDFGDDAQVLGIRAYKNLVSSVERLKGTPGWEWLHAEATRGRLTIQIEDEEHGRLILRVWRSDDPEQEPEAKRLIVAKECQGMLELFPTPKGTIDRWGLVYQTDTNRLADTAYLIGYNSVTGEAISYHEVPRTTISGTVTEMDSFPEPIKVATPKPKLKTTPIPSNERNEKA